MGSIPQRQTVVPPTATATYTPLTGWTRPPSTTMQTSPRAGGLWAADFLMGVSAQIREGITVPPITGGSSHTESLTFPLPDLPALSPTSSEEPILLVQAFASHAVAHLIVSGIDVCGHALSPNSAVPIRAAYYPAGGALSTWSAWVSLFLQTDGTDCAGGTLKVRVNAELFIRRLGQPS